METQELAALLKKLQSELESGKPVDPSLKQSLLTLDQDIQKVLAQGSPLVGHEDEVSINERALELETRFAADHPYLATTLRDVMDTLGKMGI
jgi:Domain of unknown function (DUF4404)